MKSIRWGIIGCGDVTEIKSGPLGVGKCPSTGVSAARTSAVMDAALAGYYQGREDDFWQRPGTWGRK